MDQLKKEKKIVKIGNKPFEIPAVLNIAEIAEIWRDDSQEIDAFVSMLVKSSPRLAVKICHAVCTEKGWYLIPKDDWSMTVRYIRTQQ